MLPGLQEVAAGRFNEVIYSSLTEEESEQMLVKVEDLDGRPHWIDSELVFGKKQLILAVQRLLISN